MQYADFCNLCAGPAEIVEQRCGQDGATTYYVHYVDCECLPPADCTSQQAGPRTVLSFWHGFERAVPRSWAGDKRLDEWVPSARLSQLVLRPSAQLDALTPRLCSLPSLSL